MRNAGLGERTNEAHTLHNIGSVYANLGEKQKALEYYNQALSLYRVVNDKPGEAKTLYNTGLVYHNSGEYQQALEHFNQALTIYQAIGNSADVADTLTNLGNVYTQLSEYQKAINSYNQALSLYRNTGDRAGEGRMLVNIASAYMELREMQKALEYANQALVLWQELKDRQGEAYALASVAGVYLNLSEYQKALNYYSQALSLLRAIQDREKEAYVLHQIGFTYQEMGEIQKALDVSNQALTILKTIGNPAREAITLNNLGNLYRNIGEYQQALDAFTQAMVRFHAIGNRLFEAKALSNIGTIYDILGEQQRAIDYFNQALPLHRSVGDKEGEAITLNNIGNIFGNSGDQQKALQYYNQARGLHQAVGSRYGEAITLDNIGNVHNNLSEHQKALEYHNQALLLRRTIGDRYGEAYSLHNIGSVYRNSGKPQKALEYYNQALALRQAISDRYGEAFTLTEIAGIEAAGGNLNQARNQVEAAIAIIEKLRTNINSSDLRASYFASMQTAYTLYIDILMSLHQQNPNAGYDKAAFEVTERARARSLLELLNEARADIRKDVDPELREKERQLQQRLTARTQYQFQLLKGEHTEEQAEAVRKEISELQTQLQLVETEIRTKNPRYAELTQPQPLTLSKIQQQVVDSDTILLSYWLGEERSYLWAVTPTSITVHQLPKRADIEAAAREFINYLTIPSLRFETPEVEKKAAILSQMLLAPVAEQLQQKRLLIIGDGTLQYVPFSALPVPQQSTTANAKPLVVEHEIVNLPSASTLASIRRDLRDRTPAPKAVAVLADPVFDDRDQRVRGTSTKQVQLSQLQNLTRGTNSQVQIWQRLAGTRLEAERILNLVPSSQTMQAFDFAANLETATNPALSQYRIIHFATHGFLNTQNPELSGIVLSLVNQQGAPQNGYLLTPAIFNLNLPAELVVLSACQTGLGKDVKGEGLVGLTRGLMYAGAARVMVSLWSVGDEGTAELIFRFYQKMLQEGLPPASALRAAQLSMLQEGQEPYYWAAFTLQGEWR